MSEQESENTTEIQLEERRAPELKACTFSVGSHTFSIPLEYVQEITEISEIFPLPLTPHYIDGIIHLRGSAIPVINIGKIKKIDEEQGAARGLIVIDVGNDKLGIAVREMPDLSDTLSGEVINVQKFFETYRIA